MKKKIYLVLLISFLLTSCVPSTESDNEDHTKVLTSFYPMYLLAQEVTKGVDGIDLYNMAQPQTGCLHDYTLTTSDMQKLEAADILLINGGGMEHFLDQALEQFPDLVIVDTSEGIDLLESEHNHHHVHEEVDEHENEHEGEVEHLEACEGDGCGNSHIWLSPSRACGQVINMAKGLSEVMPEESRSITKNAEELVQQLIKLQEEAEVLRDNHGQINVAVFHEGFEYLTELFHMNAHVQILVDENEAPSAKELAAAVDEIRNEDIQFYLVADDAGKKYAEVLAKECGGEVIVLNPITGNVTDGETYISAMEFNIRTIKAFLKGGYHDES